jgi:predicted transposase YbfD/YdcC
VEAESIGLPHVRSVIAVERVNEHVKSGKVERGVRYFVSSLSVEEMGSGAGVAAIIRGHWSVENKNHWLRDAQWQEDSPRHRSAPLARLLAVLRGPLLALRRQSKQSTPELSMRCSKSPSYALKLLSAYRG